MRSALSRRKMSPFIFVACPEQQNVGWKGDEFGLKIKSSLHNCHFRIAQFFECGDLIDLFINCGFSFLGGGAIEMELSKMLRDYSRTIAGKEQLLIGAIAKALEIVPRQLCDNAGFDATNILNKLRQKHAQGKLKIRFIRIQCLITISLQVTAGTVSMWCKKILRTTSRRVCGSPQSSESMLWRRLQKLPAWSCPWMRRSRAPSRTHHRCRPVECPVAAWDGQWWANCAVLI